MSEGKKTEQNLPLKEKYSSGKKLEKSTLCY